MKFHESSSAIAVIFFTSCPDFVQARGAFWCWPSVQREPLGSWKSQPCYDDIWWFIYWHIGIFSSNIIYKYKYKYIDYDLIWIYSIWDIWIHEMTWNHNVKASKSQLPGPRSLTPRLGRVAWPNWLGRNGSLGSRARLDTGGTLGCQMFQGDAGCSNLGKVAKNCILR
jgi:hypothetical protein